MTKKEFFWTQIIPAFNNIYKKPYLQAMYKGLPKPTLRLEEDPNETICISSLKSGRYIFEE